MAKTFEIKKKKRVKTWLRKTMLYAVLPAYLAFLLVTGIIICVLLVCNLPETVFEIIAFSFLALLVIVSLLTVFLIIPLCRAKQATFDFENYDFSPYVANDTETFSQTVQTEKYYFTTSPFDDDEGIIELSDNKAAEDYFSQFAPERLKCLEQLYADGEFFLFNVIDLKNDFFKGTVEKRNEDGLVTVTVTENMEVTFAPDGVHIGENCFPYDQCEAQIFAEFVQPYARVAANVYIILSEDYVARFAFGTRIMSIIDKHEIALENRELADFILSEPKNAFRLLGLKRKISKNKLRRQRCNNRQNVI